MYYHLLPHNSIPLLLRQGGWVTESRQELRRALLLCRENSALASKHYSHLILIHLVPNRRRLHRPHKVGVPVLIEREGLYAVFIKYLLPVASRFGNRQIVVPGLHG